MARWGSTQTVTGLNVNPLRLNCRAVRYQTVTDVDTEFQDDHLDEAEQALAMTRARLAGIPAETVVANHAIGLYELAAIHLSAQPADLSQASLAIDALGGLLEAVGARLGEDALTLEQALTTIRLAFVSVTKSGSNDHPAH